HVSDKIALLNAQRNAEWNTPFTPENAKQAVFMFNGDVYEGMDANTLDIGQIRYLQNHVRLLSGLYGLLRPLDLIQPYRLEMGTPFANLRGKNLY
ncbi:peroxide stress protein YaaA, partial [Enterobacter hormaechei subsp. steigerwaltii]|nr:peroxide stress protein YaaA [Enterobacter hormaechei subsp. steigerwaltii]